MEKILRIASYSRCAKDAKTGPLQFDLFDNIEFFYKERRGEKLFVYSDQFDYNDPDVFLDTVNKIIRHLEKCPQIMVLLPAKCKNSILHCLKGEAGIKVFDIDGNNEKKVEYILTRGSYSHDEDLKNFGNNGSEYLQILKKEEFKEIAELIDSRREFVNN